MNDWQGPGTLFARRQFLARLHFFVSFLLAACSPLALASRRPFETALFLLILSRAFYLIGRYFSQSAGIAVVGAVGEDDVAAVLATLPAGWKFERNIQIIGGDIDFLVTSPEMKTFLLDAKAHSGTVFYDGVRLLRKVKGKQVPFEKDILSQIKRQAVLVRTERKLSFVHAVIVFTRADVQVSATDIAFVKVVSARDLLPSLMEDYRPKGSNVALRTNLRDIAEHRNLAKSAPSSLLKETIFEADYVASDRCKGEVIDSARASRQN